jgi:hypothetical protein
MSGPICGTQDPGCRGACHRARIRATRWLIRVTSYQRHCERSEAIQGHKGRLDCFVASLLAMTVRHKLSFSRHTAPEVCNCVRPKGKEGAGNAGCPMHPWSAQNAVVSHRFTGLNRHSLHNGFTASFVLSPATGLSCHRRLASNPARLDASVGASGPHDFAVRNECRSSRAKGARNIIAATASHPTQNDGHDTPLVEG